MTSVEWLDNELWKLRLLLRSGDITYRLYFVEEEKLFQQAKEKNKKEIIDAWNSAGYEDGYHNEIEIKQSFKDGVDAIIDGTSICEDEYYNKKYPKNETRTN